MSNVPMIDRISWKAMLLQFLFMVLCYSVAAAFYPEEAFLLGVGSYFLVTVVLKYTMMMPFRKGIAYVRMGHFSDAISSFGQSIEFLDKNPWVDQYRAILLANPSAFSYKELALHNTAFAQNELGEKKEANKTLKRLREEFPESKLLQ